MADGFAAVSGTPPQRYRVYLADNRAWKSWYGGERRNWVAGYHKALNRTGSDLVLRADAVLGSDRRLRETIGRVAAAGFAARVLGAAPTAEGGGRSRRHA